MLKFDFTSMPLQRTGFSQKPMTILDPAEPKAMLCAMIEVALIETGDRAAREHWQRIQLRNLLRHARERSAFWRRRIGRDPSAIQLSAMPVLTRRELSEQVASEGPLLEKRDAIPISENSTSGSSGTPVRFSFSAVNGQYNVVRSAAQYFIEGRDISLNRTRLRETYEPQTATGIYAEKMDSWLGPIAPLFKSGINKRIDYRVADVCKLVAEMQRDAVGYLICPSRILETIFKFENPEFLKRAKTAMWVPVAEGVSQDLRDTFSRLQIPIRSTYSSEEVGAIGFECSSCPGHYHVATSNVLVEIGDTSYEIDGARLGKVLVTHLHSYATPFIRYDLDDLACLRPECPCGHAGPVIHNLHGRLSGILKHRDGSLSPFHIRAVELVPLVEFTEYRMRQTALDKIVLEVGGRSELAPKELGALRDLLQQRSGPDFEIEIRACREIDWGENRKRLGFRCEIA